MVAPLLMMGLSAAAGAVQGLSGGGGQPAAGKAPSGDRKAADEFETMFLEQSLDRLTQNLGTEGPLGENGEGGSIYKSMLSKEYARSIVKSGGVGIGDQVFAQMLKMQEAGGVGSP